MEHHPTDLKKDKRFRTIAAAFLAEQGKSQTEIVVELNRIGIPVSQPEVSRMLVQGVKDRIYTPNPRVLRDAEGKEGVNDTEWSVILNWFYRDEALEAKLKQWSPEVVPIPYVVKAPELKTGLSKEEQRHALDAHFYPVAATYVRELLIQSQTIGVLWGRTISNLIEALRAIVLPSERDVKVVPLCGEPLYLSNERQVHYSASLLAQQLRKILTKSQKSDTPSLIGVPCYVRSDLFTDKFNTFLQNIPGYAAIFGPKVPGKRHPKALINAVDTMITSMGIFLPNDQYNVSFLHERVQLESKKPQPRLIASVKDLDELVLGDIGGFLIGRPHLTREQREKVDKLNYPGWTGVQAFDLKAICQRGLAGDGSGVVVIAFQEEKWQILRHVIKVGQYVNRMIISEALAKRLKDSED